MLFLFFFIYVDELRWECRKCFTVILLLTACLFCFFLEFCRMFKKSAYMFCAKRVSLGDELSRFGVRCQVLEWVVTVWGWVVTIWEWVVTVWGWVVTVWGWVVMFWRWVVTFWGWVVTVCRRRQTAKSEIEWNYILTSTKSESFNYKSYEAWQFKYLFTNCC